MAEKNQLRIESQRKNYSIRSVILTLMISQIFIAILVTGFLWYSNGNSAVKTLSKNLSSEIGLRIEERILSVLDTAMLHASHQKQLFSTQLITIGSKDQRSQTLAYQRQILDLNPQITTLFTCTPDGELHGLQRESNGGYATLKSLSGKPGLMEVTSSGEEIFSDSFNATERPWFREAVTKRQSGWTPVYSFSGVPQLGLTCYEVINNDSEVKLISACDLTLGPLSQFLSQLNTSEHGETVLLDANGVLIASSALDSFKEIKSELPDEIKYQRVRGENSSSLIIQAAVSELTRQFGPPSKWTNSGTLEIESEEGDIYVSWLAVRLDEEERWISMLAIPRSDLTAEISQRTRYTAIAFLILILLTIPLVWRTAEGITRPVMELNRGMDRIAQFKIADSEIASSSRPSKLRELGEMQSRMELMRHALASFEKYVPSRVVRKLVTEDKIAVPGMEEATACVFFSDIIGFTEVAESLDPELLVEIGGEYLESMSQQIHHQNGILDKFIGDAIMAFWIAEVDGKRVTAKACHAALVSQQCLKKLREGWRERSLPALRARIGLHTGPVRVGNIGSSTRLNYTILGDSVNLASRLEGLNKVYGTEIIVSEEVQSIAGDDFHFRMLDIVSVKGRRQGGAVFELVCLAEEATQQQIEIAQIHSSAFDSYVAGNFDQALSLFRNIQNLKPNDRPSKILIDRCEKLLKSPPEDWSGVIAIDRNIQENG